ncbi:MAG TPA: hypothetical protein VMP01_09110 [Pirellulaceae bacterium]|nr:hypothetical protein [Pirellulaceae bacterium]
MSKKSSVHPDYYKTAGREPQGQAVIQEVERQKFREQEAFLEKQAGRRNLVPAANRVPTPEQNRSRDTKSGQANNREREHVNDQPPKTKASVEKKATRRVAGKATASAEKKPARRLAGNATASAEKKRPRRVASKATKRAPAPRAAKPKSKSQKQVSKRAVEKRPRPSARSGRK